MSPTTLLPVAELRGHEDGPIHIIRFTADGKYCITGANDRTVRLWNPTRIDPACNYTNAHQASSLHHRSTSSFVASAANDPSQQGYYGGDGGQHPRSSSPTAAAANN